MRKTDSNIQPPANSSGSPPEEDNVGMDLTAALVWLALIAGS